ncbi:MAG TPA: LytR C-terminal domain-containing protein [Patescibacteria group bacterium]|nr:LytR C-terminal domain-containing protein [Patescibacteria group bacterium]
MAKKKISEAEIEKNEEVAPLVIEEAPKKSKLSLTSHSIAYLIVLFVIILCFIGMAFFYVKFQNSINKSFGVPTIGAPNTPDKNKELLDAVSKIAELPPNETPTFATVSDVTKLSGQSFFANAQNGDQVLIYNNAKKAYLYRPSTGKIVNIGPVALSNDTVPSESASPSAAATPTALPKVVILNGSTKVGLTKIADSKLKADKVKVQVADRDNARLNTYQDTLVVDITGQHKDAIASIIKAIGGKQAPLPKGEVASSSADILIILGSDFNSAQ